MLARLCLRAFDLSGLGWSKLPLTRRCRRTPPLEPTEISASSSTRTAIWVFKPEQTAPCFTHDRMCPCYPGTVIKNGLDDFEFAVPLSDKQKQELSTASSFSVTPTTVTPTPWWGSWWSKRCFNPYISVDEKKDPPMIMNIAGVACTDYTSLGNQRRQAGMTDAVHSVWRAERKELGRLGLEDVFSSSARIATTPTIC